ncbi:MAG: hypothetical protein ACU0FH_18945 [Heliomarina sp.]|uniref:hypothetical protein n=1 Tax=Heliomarina sp. TaxID=2917556 RepID=UPI00405A3DBA
MARLSILILPVMALMTGPVIVLAGAPSRGDRPVLVVSLPWGPSSEQIVQRAGGRLLGPETAPLGVLATSDVPEFRSRLRDEGAILVVGASLIASICGI